MKNRLALLATLVVLVAPFAEAGELKGRILVGDKPASGVTVSALPHETPFDEGKREAKRGEAPKALAQVTTGANGSFVLTVPPTPGKPEPLFQVRIEGGGVTATSYDGLFDASESEDLGDLPVSKGEKLAGKVVGEAGVPIEGAVVTLVAGRDRNDDGNDLRRAPRKATTGADGTFRFDDAFASQNTLTVEKEGYAVSRLTSVRSGAVTKPIALAKGAELAGSVRRADKKGPAANALVRFEGKATTRWVVTSEDGSFRIPNAPDGKGTLVVDAGDAGTAEIPNVTVPAERKLVATLRPPAVLEGRVLDAKSGKALPRVKIQLKGNGTRLARSGPDGKYRISPIAPPVTSLRADEPRYVPYTKELSIAAGETRKLDLPLTLGATLTGRVVDETSAPVGGAKGQLAKTGEGGAAAIFLRLRGGSGSVDFKSLPDGSFKATRLAPGENQRLSVKHPDFETATLGGVSLQPGATKANVVVTLKRGASVFGVVKDTNGNPIANAEVSVASALSFRGGRGGINLSMIGGAESRPATKSGADGTFEVRGLAPGDYTVSVRLRGYAGETVDPVKVTEEGVKERLAITLQPGASIHGIVKSKSGAPMEGYVVNASAAGRGPRRMGLGPMEATGPDGLFSVEDLKAGETYDVQIFGGTGAGPQKKVTAPADGVELVVTGNGKIAGTAVDAQSGRPLTDFSVSFEPNQSGPGGGMVFRMVSRSGQRIGGIGQRTEVHADDGAFLLEDVPAGKWQVVVEAKGYQAARVGGVTVEEGQTAANVEVKVPRGATLKGHVTDGRSRRSLPDVSVTSESAGGGPGGMVAMLAGMGGEGSLNTDADGRFEQEGLAPGKYKITARHPEYAEATETVELKETGTSVELQLTTGGAVGGTVFSDNRQPLPGVDVSLAAAGEGGFGRMVGLGGGQQSTTDASGRFRFDHLTAGRFTVSATLRSKSASPVDVVLQAGETKEDVALTLAAGATIRGLVSGLPEAQRAAVNVTGSGPDGFFATTRTGADGRFELAGVPVGAISLRAQAGDFMSGSRSATKQVPVADGQAVVDAEIVFETGFTLSGRVVRSGQGVAGANVNAFQQGGGSSANVRADDSGNYRLEGLLEGTYTVSANSRDFSGSSRSETVKLAGDPNLDITFPSARIAGTVVEAGSRLPLADAVIEVASDDSSGPRFFRSYRTDSNGRFALEDVDPKPMTLTVRRPDYLFEKRTVTPAEGSGGGNDLTIELTRGEGIGIEVKDGLYRVPLRGALARVLDAQKTPVFTGSVSLDTEGRGDIPSLKPGRYTVQVDASGYAPATIDGVNVPSSRLSISLTPGGTVEIHSGPQTLAQGTAKAQILGPNGQPYAFNLFGADGTVILSNPVRRLENFAPGTYAIAVTGGATKSFNVSEGGTTIVALP